jgi:hypothetical protein
VNATALQERYDGAERATSWVAPDMSILTGGRTTPPPFPHDLFGTLWPLVSDLADGAGAPIDYVGVSVLAVAASLVGAKRRVQPFTTAEWREPCILWLAAVGDPSANKSPAIDAGTSPLRGMEAEYAETHKSKLQSYEAVLERANAERKRWQEDVKTAAKENISTPPLPSDAVAPNPPQRRRLFVQDSTPEALGEILSGNPNGVLHNRDELAGWLMSFERYAPGGREFWLEAYGGRSHVIDRKSMKEPLIIPFNGVTVLGGIQPEKLADCLLDVADDGLVARFIWAWPDPIPYRRPRNLADVALLDEVYRRLASLSATDDEAGGISADVLPLEAAAADIFEAWIGENASSVQDAASLYKGFCGKLRGTALRLSLVCELLAWAATGKGAEPTMVSVRSLVAALEFIESYAKPTAIRVFGDAALPASERNAAMLARQILRKKAERINVREVKRQWSIPTLKTTDKVEEAIEALVEANWLRSAPIRAGGTPGRASKDYLVNPAVLSSGHE